MITFPVSTDTALMMAAPPSGKLFNYDKEMPADMVHATNLATATESERLVLGRDENYFRSIVAEAGIVGTTPAPFVDIGTAPKRSLEVVRVRNTYAIVGYRELPEPRDPQCFA